MSLNGIKQKPQIMPITLFESIAEQLFPKTRILELSCGFEPFMTKNFLDYARIAQKWCKGHISICTNGLLLDEDIIETIVNEILFDEINISIDGLTKKTYDSIRINGNFEKLLSILLTLKEKKQKSKAKKPEIRLNYTMLRRNIEELGDIYKFVNKYDIQSVQLRHAKLTKPFSSLFNESLFYHQDLYDFILNKIKCQFDNDKTKTLVHPCFFSDSRNLTTDKSVCAYPWFYFVVSSNGNVRMCHIGLIGNFTKLYFKDMVNSERIKNIRSRLLRGDYIDICNKCYGVTDLGQITKRDFFIREDID
jgi:MoaA/NifB/PqqE/SkfB family radical SAM enzyme